MASSAFSRFAGSSPVPRASTESTESGTDSLVRTARPTASSHSKCFPRPPRRIVNRGIVLLGSFAATRISNVRRSIVTLRPPWCSESAPLPNDDARSIATPTFSSNGVHSSFSASEEVGKVFAAFVLDFFFDSSDEGGATVTLRQSQIPFPGSFPVSASAIARSSSTVSRHTTDVTASLE